MALGFETEVIFVLGISLVISFIFNLLSKKLKLPLLIAPLFIGLAINAKIINLSSFSNHLEILSIFSNFGIVVVLFYIGLRVDFRYLKDLSRNSSIMALNAGHMPFFFGLFATYIYTRDFVQAIFVGIALAITAEEVSVAILDELSLLKKRVGQLIIEAGIIGDIFEISAITLLGLFIRTQSVDQNLTLLQIAFDFMLFVLVLAGMRYKFVGWLLDIPGKTGKKFEYFGIAFIVLMVLTLSSELLGFSHIIGALLAGIILKDKLIEDKLYYAEHHIIEAIEVFTFGVFHPLIFIWIGVSLDLQLLFSNMGFGLILTILALSGKVIGAMLGNYFCHEPIQEGILIGWGLNARGATELFALLIAQSSGIIGDDVFAAVVFMALVTTIVSPIVFKFMVLKGYGMVNHNKHKHN